MSNGPQSPDISLSENDMLIFLIVSEFPFTTTHESLAERLLERTQPDSNREPWVIDLKVTYQQHSRF